MFEKANQIITRKSNEKKISSPDSFSSSSNTFFEIP